MIGLEISGVLVIDKLAGVTSHDVVARVRRILGIRQVGHFGTLDPFATGVLPILGRQGDSLCTILSEVPESVRRDHALRVFHRYLRLHRQADLGELASGP